MIDKSFKSHTFSNNGTSIIVNANGVDFIMEELIANEGENALRFFISLLLIRTLYKWKVSFSALRLRCRLQLPQLIYNYCNNRAATLEHHAKP